MLLVGWRRKEIEGEFPLISVSLGILAIFLLVSKVHSPQYALWLVPLLAMLNIPWRYVLFYFVADLGVFVSGFLRCDAEFMIFDRRHADRSEHLVDVFLRVRGVIH